MEKPVGGFRAEGRNRAARACGGRVSLQSGISGVSWVVAAGSELRDRSSGLPNVLCHLPEEGLAGAEAPQSSPSTKGPGQGVRARSL